MPLFGGGKIDPEKQARAEASLQSIMQGGLPLNAVDRLREQASRQGTPDHLFTSDLSVNELLLTHECGFDPLGQVMGSCVYNVGWQYTPTSGWFSSAGELQVLSQSQMEARRLAFQRLRQEAKLLNADGVVGVRLERRQGDIGIGMIEFVAIGTAVRRRGAPPLAQGVEPFVSNLSGQDHWTLRKGGYKPVGFAFGNCSWFQPNWRSVNANLNLNNLPGVGTGLLGVFALGNVEMSGLTQGVYAARELAMGRLEADSQSYGAHGVVGMVIDSHEEIVEAQNQSGGVIFHFTALGTAVVQEDISNPTAVSPYVTLADNNPL